MSAKPATIYLKDYQAPAYRVITTQLRFELDPHVTRVQNDMHMQLSDTCSAGAVLQLYGDSLQLEKISIDGRGLSADEYQLQEDQLLVHNPPQEFNLQIHTRIAPENNTALEGLYRSGGNYCTQCEAEGFRRISYYPDRPDVMSVYTTTIVADKQGHPVLLANGNCVDSGELEDGRHFATWHDPYPKPSYLFALVAGDLACVEDRFTTASGREVLLQIYVQHGNEGKCEHAMRSLKKAMAWDEQVYGREYDLDRYMIVAVDDFNMGAMENKGLNIFNSRFVLARPETATDIDFVNIEGVIAHEYFHNWSGNRVTCRDWFQLSLKEGFTVFRDQQFTADMTSQAVKRIDDVRMLRTHQFVEDAGPMAHPIRPDSYVEINNFYTLTVYEKGAEVVRMLHTLLGSEGFRKGSDLYFQRHDGQAVTTEDFVCAMEDANAVKLEQFRLWYSQAGTPELKVQRRYDEAAKTYTLTLQQSSPATPGQAQKQALHIPVRIALLDSHGKPMPLQLAGQSDSALEQILSLNEAEQNFIFEGVTELPVPSLLRGFSAPVRLHCDWRDEELAFLMAHDGDEFNRWEAAQQLAVRVLLGMMRGESVDELLAQGLANGFAQTLDHGELDPALIAEALSLPASDYLAEFVSPVDPEAVVNARRILKKTLARRFEAQLWRRYQELSGDEYDISANSMGKRRLANLCLDYLASLASEDSHTACLQQYESADNMTDSLAALTALVHYEAPAAGEALEDFYRKWHRDPLVLDKWFALQAGMPGEKAIERVHQLREHADFTLKNPNRTRALIGSFAMRNMGNFHRADGAGYQILADTVIALNSTNPQIASRLLGPLTHWNRYEPGRAALMKTELQRIEALPELSRDVFEVVNKSLYPRA